MTTGESDRTSFTAGDRFVYQADPNQPPSEAVIAAIADHSEADGPLAVGDAYGPLFDAVDPAALDALFESTGRRERSDGAVCFRYADRHVRVDSTGRVELVPAE